MRAAVSPKEERREGVRYGDEGEDQERSRGREKEQRTVHEDGECGTMSRTCEDRVLMGSTPTASAGHAVAATQRAYRDRAVHSAWNLASIRALLSTPSCTVR